MSVWKNATMRAYAKHGRCPLSCLVLGAIITAVLTTAALGDEASAGSQFQKGIRIPQNVGFATNLSDDGLAATLLFDNLFVEISPTFQSRGGTRNQTAIQTRVVKVQIPYSTDLRSLRMTMDVRGIVSTDVGATARLIACAGDAATPLSLDTDESIAVKLKGKAKDALKAEHPDMDFVDFEQRVNFKVQTRAKKPVCQITLFLLVEHDTNVAGNGGALLVVDSIDLAIAKSGKGRLQR